MCCPVHLCLPAAPAQGAGLGLPDCHQAGQGQEGVQQDEEQGGAEGVLAPPSELLHQHQVDQGWTQL